MTALSSQNLLDIEEIVKRTNISARTWRRIIRAGGITIIRIEGCVRVPEASLEEYLASKIIPARAPVRKAAPIEIESILDRHAPRKRRAAG